MSSPSPKRRLSRHSSSSVKEETEELSNNNSKIQKLEKNFDTKNCSVSSSCNESKSPSSDSNASVSASGSVSGSGSTSNDSPAFRLRPRRSTPRPSPNDATPSPGKRFSLFAALMAAENKYIKSGGTNVRRKLIFNKQKVYPPTLNTDDHVPTVRVVPLRSPSCSITEGISVSPFVQKISPQELVPDHDYGANYVSLRIIFREEIEIEGERVLKVIATQIDEEVYDTPSSSRSNITSKNVVIYLHGSYATCKADVNRVINIVKFKTRSVTLLSLLQQKPLQSSPLSSTNTHMSNVQHCSDLPFAIVVKSCENPDDLWVPFVSITSKWEPPEEPKELNRTLFMTPEDTKDKEKCTIKEEEVNCKYN